MPAAAKIDYDRIEPDWRAGIKSVPQLAAEYSISTGVTVTHAAINKHFKGLDIPRDLTAKIKAKAKDKLAKVSAAKVSGKVSERAIVEANATAQASIQIEHRTDIQKKRNLVSKLFAELDEQTENKDLMSDLRQALTENDLPGLARIAEKLTSLPSRIKGASDLVNAYKSLIGLERQAFGIDDKAHNSDDPISAILDEVARRAAPMVKTGDD